MVTAIFIPVAVIVGVVVVLLYNRLVSARQRVREAWSAMDVQLQRRASLVPNLVQVVEGYAGYERETMTKVVNARGALGAAASPPAAARANAELGAALQMLYVVAEAYPELKANERFADLQRELAATENTIAYARNYYNGAVETLNIRVETFPGNLVAGLFGVRQAEFFAADAAAVETPVVSVPARAGR